MDQVCLRRRVRASVQTHGSHRRLISIVACDSHAGPAPTTPVTAYATVSPREHDVLDKLNGVIDGAAVTAIRAQT